MANHIHYDNLFAALLGRVIAATEGLIDAGLLPAGIDLSRIAVEPPRDSSHGDMATNAAMVLAKDAGRKPRELADALAEKLRTDPLIEKVDIAGPGFINMTLKHATWLGALRSAVAAGTDFGRSRIGKGAKVNVEYVSANPTGPMHVGHCRGAVFGDALASLLAFADYDVTREYYINDAGAQVDVLARSAYLRYREALGEDIGAIPEGLYPGDYLKPVGAALVEKFGRELKGKPETEWLPDVRQTAIDMMMAMIRDDLAALNVKHDVFFSERSLIGEPSAAPIKQPEPKPAKTWSHDLIQAVENCRKNNPTWGRSKITPYLESKGIKASTYVVKDILGYLIAVGRVESTRAKPKSVETKAIAANPNNLVAKTIAWLRNQGEVYEGRLPPPKGGAADDYEDREQTLFRSTAFGDDVDRPLMKSDGSYTYFASDIAYHKSKFDRGFADMIDVWGADHGGYIKRMQAAVKAISKGRASLDVKIVQLVKLLRDGEPVKMSKRSGEFVTLREVVEEVGSDAVRFMMLYRKNDATLDFDLAKVIEQSRDNPVFYVQYAHARGHSIFRQAREVFPGLPDTGEGRLSLLSGASVDRLTDAGEMSIIRKISAYPRLLETAAQAHEPHRIAFYLYEMASEFHAHFTQGNGSPHLRFIRQDDEELTVARLALVQAVVTVFASGLGLLGVGAPKEMR